MPVADRDIEDDSTGEVPSMTELPFPPLKKAQILNCSFHAWHDKYRRITPKARCIPVTQPFLDYLRADRIVLPPEPHVKPSALNEAEASSEWLNPNSYDDDAGSTDADPSTPWSALHAQISDTIRELGGHVAPKLNWSAPKDATWINPTNSMDCPTANDIYLLLKSSDFVTHDLEHAFDGCVDSHSADDRDEIPYHLVLRKWIPGLHPSLEFRCFVRDRKLLTICQRDLNHYDFLPALKPRLLDVISAFYKTALRDSLADTDFVFDVYIPPGADGRHKRVWLIDINPWARRTDPVLFSWMELLTMEAPVDDDEEPDDGLDGQRVIRIPLRPLSSGVNVTSIHGESNRVSDYEPLTDSESGSASDSDSEASITLPRSLELRLISRNDPEAHAFSTPQYSAHKLPRDVVDASSAAARGDLDEVRDFAAEWRKLVARREKGGASQDSESDDDGDVERIPTVENGLS